MRATQVPSGRWALRMAALVAVVAMFTRTSQAEVVSRSLLVVHIAADRDEAAALQAVLRDVVFGQPVDLEMSVVARIEPGTVIRGSGADRANPPLGRAFLDLSDPARATVYVVDGAWQRILVRHVPRTTNPDVVRETVGRIVSTSVEALLAGSFGESSEPMGAFDARVANSSPKATANVPGNGSGAPGERFAPEPRERARSNLSGGLGVMYEMGLYARGAPVVHGPALYGGVAIGAANLRPALWMTAQYRWPIVSENPPVGFRLDTTALRLLAGAELEAAPRLT